MSLLSRVTAEVRTIASRFAELRATAAGGGSSRDAIESLFSEVSSLASTLGGRLGADVEKLRARANEKDPDRQTCGPKTAKRMQDLCCEFDELAKGVAELEASLRDEVDKAKRLEAEEQARAAAIAAQRAAEAAAAREAADAVAAAEAKRQSELAARIADEASTAAAAQAAAQAAAEAEAEANRKRLRKEQAAVAEAQAAVEVAAATERVAADGVDGSRGAQQPSSTKPSSGGVSVPSGTAEPTTAGSSHAASGASGTTLTESLRRSQPTLKIVTDSAVMRRELEFAGRRQETVAVFWCPKALDAAAAAAAAAGLQQIHAAAAAEEFVRKQSALVAFLKLRCPDMPLYHCCLPLAAMQAMRPGFPPDVQASLGGHVQDAALSLSIHAAAVVHRFPLQDKTGSPSAEAPDPSSLPALRRSVEDVLDAADAFVVASVLRSRHARLVNVSVPNVASESGGSSASSAALPSSSSSSSSLSPPSPATLGASATPADGSSRNAAPVVTMVGVVTNLKRLKTSTGGGHTYLKALNLLRQIVGKIVENPSEPRYQRIKLQSKAYQSKLASFDGGPQCMHACGFREQVFSSALGDDRYLVMTAKLDDPSQVRELRSVVEALSAAISRLETSASRASNTSAAAAAAAPAPASFSTPSGNIAGTGGFAPGLGQGDLASMMSNPMVQQAMQNPELLRSLMGGGGGGGGGVGNAFGGGFGGGSGGGLGAVLQSPLAQEMLRNPQLMQDTMQRMQQNPEMMRAAQELARQMGGGGFDALGAAGLGGGLGGSGLGLSGLNARARAPGPAPAPAPSGFGFGGYTPPPSSASPASSSSGQSTAQGGASTSETDDAETANNAANSRRQNHPGDDQRSGS